MRGRGDVLEEGHNRFLTLIVLKLAVVWTATRIDYTELEKDQGRVKTGGNKTKQKKITTPIRRKKVTTLVYCTSFYPSMHTRF